MDKIESFKVNHNLLEEGIYVSRVDGDITTYDLRFRKPNSGLYLDSCTIHSVEHLMATILRNSEYGSHIIYFGPMGCQTGFYLLVRDADNQEVLIRIIEALEAAVDWNQGMPGSEKEECGNYRNLSLKKAKIECSRYLRTLMYQIDTSGIDFKYKE